MRKDQLYKILQDDDWEYGNNDDPIFVQLVIRNILSLSEEEKLDALANGCLGISILNYTTFELPEAQIFAVLQDLSTFLLIDPPSDQLMHFISDSKKKGYITKKDINDLNDFDSTCTYFENERMCEICQKRFRKISGKTCHILDYIEI